VPNKGPILIRQVNRCGGDLPSIRKRSGERRNRLEERSATMKGRKETLGSGQMSRGGKIKNTMW